MLKETHTISYIQQVRHEWIMGDEEEIAYAQTIENLRVVPFGLKNAPIFFQQIMEQVFEREDFLKCYIDDIVMHSKGFLQHLAHLEELFKRATKSI
jgi:hypothetical protein